MSKPLYLIIFLLFKPSLVQPSSVNVGTVLFTQQDLSKSCWSIESIALLTTRMMLEDLIPQADSVVINCDDYVSDLVNYFKEILGVVRQECGGKRKHIILMALTDILGGFLKSVVIPRAKYSFYAGVIEFNSVVKLMQLYEEMKWFLKTNGLGWAKPIDNGDPKITPINMDTISGGESCSSLIFYERPPPGKCCTPFPKPMKCTTTTTECTEVATPASSCRLRRFSEEEPRFTFPIPFFDKKTHPSAIAIPFKYYTLRNIESKRSANLIYKFFLAVYTCMCERQVDAYSRRKFYDELYSWLHQEVIPKLDDDKFYAAFGSVLRVEHTLRQFGATLIQLPTTTPKPGVEDFTDNTNTETDVMGDKSKMIIMVVLILLFVWFLLGILFLCFKMRSKKHPPCACTMYIDQSKTSTSPTESSSRVLQKCSCDTYQSTSATDSKSKSTSGTHGKTTVANLITSSDYTKQMEPQVATIETIQSLKMLPSIEEISERSSKDGKRSYHLDDTSSESSSYSLESVDEAKAVTAAFTRVQEEQYTKQLSKSTCSQKKSSMMTHKDPKEASSHMVTKPPRKKESISNEASNSEDTSSKTRSSGTTASSSGVKQDKRDSSDLSTDATSQVYKLSKERMSKKKESSGSVTGSSEGKTTSKSQHPSKLKHSTQTSSEKPSDKRYVFGYDFHTSSSGDSTSGSEDSTSGERSCSTK